MLPPQSPQPESLSSGSAIAASPVTPPIHPSLPPSAQANVFCTEPFRVPLAGKVTHAFFDKTGTITTDQLITRGIVNGGGASSNAASSTSVDALPRKLAPANLLSAPMACIIGGCHSLLQAAIFRPI